MNVVYYKFSIKLMSPLAIGAGDSISSDSDVMLNGSGKPFIPATSLCGVLRSCFNSADAQKIFGEINNSELQESAVRIYDAKLNEEAGNKAFTTIRNGVKLKNKVAEDAAKYDFEAIETGAAFDAYIEITDLTRCSSQNIESALAKLSCGELLIGSKTSRGYGRVQLENVQKKAFDTAHEDWLDFDQFNIDCWAGAENPTLKNNNSSFHTIKLDLEQNGGISIREYSTNIDEADYHSLTLANGTPVIPGTSWAGAFRERYAAFAGESAAEKLFGNVNKENNTTVPSQIIFGESQLADTERKVITRNAIDRFSGGAKDKSLYTEESYYNGSTTLEIKIKPNTQFNAKALFAVIADLHNGFLAVGGLTAVGRGLFTVKKAWADGRDITDFIINSDVENAAKAVQ